MKNYFSKYKYWLIVLTLFVSGTFIRLYNFPNRLIFGPEQGISLMTSAANLTKFSLLGETNLQRATSDSHIPFHGAYFSYLMLPVILLFNYRVFPITLTFVFLNLATALLFFLVSLKLFGEKVAAFALFYFLFSAVMIHHSLFIWILNPLPLLGVLVLWLTAKLFKNRDLLWPSLLIGILSGFGFGLQNLYLPFAIFMFLLTIIIARKRFLTPIIYLFGVLLGSLPTAIFDFRHDFYHVRTYWQYFWDVYFHRVSGFTDYYHFMYLYPYLFLIFAFLTVILLRIYKPLVFVPVILFLYINFTSPMFSLDHSTGMRTGLTLQTIESAAQRIATDQPPARFNVATLWDFDTRAHPFRYLLQYYYHKTPQAVEQYSDLEALYVFAPDGYPIDKPLVWELKTYLPYKVEDLALSSPGYKLYKLTK